MESEQNTLSSRSNEDLLEQLSSMEQEQLSVGEFTTDTSEKLVETCQWFHQQIIQEIIPQIKELNSFLRENEQSLQSEVMSLQSQQQHFIQLLAHLQSNINSILS